MQPSPPGPDQGASSNVYRAGGPGAGIEATHEAEQWLAAACGSGPVPPLLVVIGLADGRLLEVLETRAPGTRVLALEPDRTMAAQCLAGRRPREWRDSARLTLLVGPEYHGADEAWRLFPRQSDAFTLMLHPRLEPRGADVRQAADVAKRILVGVRGNAEARRRFAPRYLLNVVRNIPALASGRDVRELQDVFRGVPAVIVAAGPSLDAALPHLHGLADRAVIIAADTALRPLLHAGIAPRLVVAADPGEANARHFRELPSCEGTSLVAESAIDPSVIPGFEDRTFWFQLSNHHPWPWLTDRGLDVGRIAMWGSVLTAAFQTAIQAGCDPIVFVGADLAFTGDRPYCRGTTYEYDWATFTAAGRPIRDVWTSWLGARELVQVADIKGATISSSAGFVSVRDWLVARVGHSGRRVINATEAGILSGQGIEQEPLARVAARLPARLIRSLSLPRIDPVVRWSVAGRLVAPLRKAVRELRSNDATSPLREWLDFAGDRLDRTELTAALEASAQLLEGASLERARGENAPSPIIEPGDAVNTLLTALPEACDRFRLALSNHAPTRESALVDPLVALVEAFHLLQRIHAAACKQDDLPEPITIADFDGATVAARCWWGDPLRWAVTLFEGLLGAAACSPPPSSPPTSPFYTRAVVLCDEDISPSLTSLSHPHTEQACALLAFEWLRVAAAQPRVPSSEAATLLDWWRRVTATIGIGGVAARRTDATLIVEMTVADQTSSLDLMIPGARPQLARLLTGSLLDGASGALELAQMTSPGMRVSLRLEIEKAGRAESSHPPALVHEPRILLDAESGRSVVAYSAGDGVVCVTFHATRSVRVRNGGIVEPHLSWPRTIIGELPFGESGAVAWSNGLTDWRQPTPPHVMYRHAEDEEARSEELPFRPGLGTWWNGRVYWCCQPDGHGAPVGLASWAPGEQSRLEFDGLHLFDVQPFGDALLLHPRAVDASGVHRRQRTPQGWIWRPGIAPEPVTLGVSGSPTCRATNKDWDAYTYLEGDLVRIDSPFGTASMTCYAPHRVAWLGRSLVVNTFEWDVLLFDDVMTSVAHQGQPAFRSRGDSDADD